MELMDESPKLRIRFGKPLYPDVEGQRVVSAHEAQA